jgi:hypothetical protein
VKISSKIFLVTITLIITVFSNIFLVQTNNQTAFGFEENFLPLQTGIISTSVQDYAISNDFETKIYQNGKIIRLSGITTTGESYYIYQKNIGDEIILKGKILVDGDFISLIENQIVPEPQITLVPETKLLMLTKIPHHTYAGYPLGISVKIFDAKLNPQAEYEHSIGALENVFVNITITNQFDKLVSTLKGNTDSTGLFRANYIVKGGINLPGEYSINITIDDGTGSKTQSFKTFFRGEIKDYWQKR